MSISQLGARIETNGYRVFLSLSDLSQGKFVVVGSMAKKGRLMNSRYLLFCIPSVKTLIGIRSCQRTVVRHLENAVFCFLAVMHVNRYQF
jgi:hypothetical protein